MSHEGQSLRKYGEKRSHCFYTEKEHLSFPTPMCLFWLMCVPHVSFGWMNKRLDCAAFRKTGRDGGNVLIVACQVSCNPPCHVGGLGLIPRSNQTISTWQMCCTTLPDPKDTIKSVINHMTYLSICRWQCFGQQWKGANISAGQTAHCCDQIQTWCFRVVKTKDISPVAGGGWRWRRFNFLDITSLTLWSGHHFYFTKDFFWGN